MLVNTNSAFILQLQAKYLSVNIDQCSLKLSLYHRQSIKRGTDVKSLITLIFKKTSETEEEKGQLYKNA